MKSRTIAVALAAAALRQGLVLRGIHRSWRFLRSLPAPPGLLPARPPWVYVVVPVLREAAGLADTVEHFAKLTAGHAAELVVVTSERERAEQAAHPEATDTVTLAAELAAAGHCRHIHHRDPQGVKADQLNTAVAQLSAPMSAEDRERVFLLCYDADSRPPLDSLDTFLGAISRHPGADVFHQSSRFEVRQPAPTTGAARRRLLTATAAAGALRANRFVLGYELPRLMNRSLAGPLKRRLSSYVYTHVTGHGLCVRLSLLHEVPFPTGSPLEDMHYSFILGSRNVAMHPVPSLDVAEVPSSVAVQVEQAARWFYGPARCYRYLQDPQTQPGPRAWLLAGSAAAISLEWLSCSIVPTALAVLWLRGDRTLRTAVAAFTGLYTAQLLATDIIMEPSSAPRQRLTRLAGYPLNSTLFGLGGAIGTARLLRGRSGQGKTEAR